MLEFEKSIQEVAERFDANMKELSPGVFSLDIPFSLPDGSSRYQYVYCWVIKGRAKGKDCYYFNSRCGVFDKNSTDTYSLLKEASYGYYSMVTVTNDKKKDGSPCETVVVQASPIAEYINTIDELASIIWEVAEVADILEERYFGGDKN